MKVKTKSGVCVECHCKVAGGGNTHGKYGHRTAPQPGHANRNKRARRRRKKSGVNDGATTPVYGSSTVEVMVGGKKGKKVRMTRGVAVANIHKRRGQGKGAGG